MSSGMQAATARHDADKERKGARSRAPAKDIAAHGERSQPRSISARPTGWRVNGRTHWLWCFANGRGCHYRIDRCRGSPALQKFFTEAFEGVLITDFWASYGSVCAEDRQYCIVHLLRELEKVDLRNDLTTGQLPPLPDTGIAAG